MNFKRKLRKIASLLTLLILSATPTQSIQAHVPVLQPKHEVFHVEAPQTEEAWQREFQKLRIKRWRSQLTEVETKQFQFLIQRRLEWLQKEIAKRIDQAQLAQEKQGLSHAERQQKANQCRVLLTPLWMRAENEIPMQSSKGFQVFLQRGIEEPGSPEIKWLSEMSERCLKLWSEATRNWRETSAHVDQIWESVRVLEASAERMQKISQKEALLDDWSSLDSDLKTIQLESLVRESSLWYFPLQKPEVVRHFGDRSRGSRALPASEKGMLIRSRENRVRAPARGRVVYSGTMPGLGGAILIDHGVWKQEANEPHLKEPKKLYSFFGQLEQVDVNQGQDVQAAQVLGSIARGSALYFELRGGSEPMNPLRAGLQWVGN